MKIKEIDYLNNPSITQTWQKIVKTSKTVDKNPLEFIFSCYYFFNAFNNLHDVKDVERGGDDYGKCVGALSKKYPIKVGLNQAKVVNDLQFSLMGYINHSYREVKRHGSILNAEPREDIPTNELQSWYLGLAQHLPDIVRTITVTTKRKNHTMDELNLEEKVNFSLPQGLIDSSEDYFIDSTLRFIESLSQYTLQEEIPFDSLPAIRSIYKATDLLYKRDSLPIDRFKELASLAVSLDKKDKHLHNIIANFITTVPPGLIGYENLAEGERVEALQSFYRQNTDFYKHLPKPIPSQLDSYKSEANSIENKLSLLPSYNKFNSIYASSEDYFIDRTLHLMESLSQYALQEKIPIDSLPAIRSTINKAEDLLYERGSHPIDRFKELASLAASLDKKDKHLHNIIANFITTIPPGFDSYEQLPENKRVEALQSFYSQNTDFYRHLPEYTPSHNRKGQSFKKAKKTYEQASNKLNISEDYFFEITFALIRDLAKYVLDHPEATIMHDRQHVVNVLLKKCKGCLSLQDEDDFNTRLPPLTRLEELAHSAIENDHHLNGELHTIIKSFMSKIHLASYLNEDFPCEKRVSDMQTKFKELYGSGKLILTSEKLEPLQKRLN